MFKSLTDNHQEKTKNYPPRYLKIFHLKEAVEQSQNNESMQSSEEVK